MATQPPVALITGVTGQDGAYLSRFLLNKGYIVHGTKRRGSSFNTGRVDGIYQDPHYESRNFILHYGDMTDSSNLLRIIQEVQPTEIYNLAAQSQVHVSFELPEYTANADALGTLRMLEAMRVLNLRDKTRFYQASTSEMYGSTPSPQNEKTPFYPRSPYGAAKAYAHMVTVNYREAYGLHASSGILFNHESPVRGETFVTRKITRGIASIHHRLQEKIYLGNLEARRDWGHAADYVRGMWLMLQQPTPDDYVLATGKQYSVRQFVEHAFAVAGYEIAWSGKELNEVGRDRKSGRIMIEIDPRYFRPTEVEDLLGDASKAHRVLGWKPEISFEKLVNDMVEHDLRHIQRDSSYFDSVINV